MSRRVLSTLGLLLPLLAALAGAAPRPAVAQAPETVGIRIVDAPTSRADDPRARLYIVDHVAPGTTISRRVEVDNNTSMAQTVQLYAAAADIGDGEFRFADGRTANDLTRWTTVDPPTLPLAAGANGLATVTIAVPAKATAGEQYAVVWAELTAPAPPGGGIAAVNRVGVRIYLSVGAGGEPPTDFTITSLQGQRAADGSPVVAATVHNTGGRAVDLSGQLMLTNGPGGLSAGPFPATLGTTLGVDQTEPVLVTLDKSIPNGPWDAKVVLQSGTTTREGSATITFPTQPATSSPPVRTNTPNSGNGTLVVVGAAVPTTILLVLLLVLWRRRKHEDAPVSPA